MGSYTNIFATESFMDELAQMVSVEPVQFRLSYLEDERVRTVVEVAAEVAGWQPRIRPRDDGQGRGVTFSQYKNRQCYIAVVVDLRVDRASGAVHLERAVIAADVGQIVNPASLSNQLEGACLQSASWTLREEVIFDRHGITSVDWKTYPILRSRDVPEIETVLLNHPGQPWLGVAEGAMGPTQAAIANAIYDAVGTRLRKIPFTAGRVRAGCGSET